MEREKHQDTADLIQLGSISGDTRGNGGVFYEAFSLGPWPGLSAE